MKALKPVGRFLLIFAVTHSASAGFLFSPDRAGSAIPLSRDLNEAGVGAHLVSEGIVKARNDSLIPPL
jgi:hypothetical protein